MFADAIKAAKKSTIKRHKTGAAIYDKNGKLLATGYSHVPEGDLSATPWSVHAELAAIRKLRKKRAIDQAHSIVIATITRSGNLTNGAPCLCCAGVIEQTPIQQIFYTQRR